MRAYHESARLLAALVGAAAAAATLTTGRPGRLSRVAAAAAGALVGRRLAGALRPPGRRTDDRARPSHRMENGPDELRLWVAADLPARPRPATDPLSS
ncbi:hypothetical protein ACL02O_14870 [Micromonospora sp. MS34]|uniref:hypothetical protein n=1 Tax=Micromonospora sp. MS34 TaxID=3385971 RepID=UPI0039A1C2B0